MKYCSRCKTTDNLMPKPYSWFKNKEVLYQYYMCRECNTKRAKKYRATDYGKLAIEKAVRTFTQKNPLKRRAWDIIANEKRTGRIEVPYQCENCQGIKPLDAHHDDYSKPLEIKWLCRVCHQQVGRVLKDPKKPLTV